MKKRIALLYGGASKEHDVSVAGYEYLSALLCDTEYEILPVYIYIWFENCKSIGFTAEGWTDYNNQNRDEGGHPISFRLAGFIGHIMAGSAGFENCHVENITLYGFHNLAAFVGYDAVGNVDAYAYANCTVKNASFYFSYCLASSYTVDMPRKFVSVFYNGPKWVDNIDDCVDLGNSFEGVSFYDVSDDNTEYTPSDFRSWTAEEAAAS